MDRSAGGSDTGRCAVRYWPLQAPVKQLIIRHLDGGQDVGHEVTVVTRFHHAACDGASASLWLAHQWKVAFGHDAPLRNPAAGQPPRLRRHAAPVRRGRSAPRGPTPRLLVEDAPPTRTRRWRTFAFSARSRAGGAGDGRRP